MNEACVCLIGLESCGFFEFTPLFFNPVPLLTQDDSRVDFSNRELNAPNSPRAIS